MALASGAMSTLRPVLVAAGLLAGSLSISSVALACPGAKSSNKQEMAAVHTQPEATLDQGAYTECGYARSRREGCCGSSFASRLLGVAAPAGLVAFGLGWLTGGRRKRRSDEA